MNLSQVALVANDLDRPLVLYVINLPIAVAYDLLAWNTLRAAAFFPFFIMLVVMLAISYFSFSRSLLFLSIEETRS